MDEVRESFRQHPRLCWALTFTVGFGLVVIALNQGLELAARLGLR